MRKFIRTCINLVPCLLVSYDFGRWEFRLNILNIFDAEDDDIAYYFESRLTGESGVVEDVHFHPVIPRSARLSARYEF